MAASDPGAIGVSGHRGEDHHPGHGAGAAAYAVSKTGRYRVALTRTGDRTCLARRNAWHSPEKHDADLLIAIHADASRDHRARGASVYVSSSDVTTQFAADQRQLAGRIARALAAPEPQPAPGSAWLQYSMIEQLDDDVRMTGRAGASRASLCPGFANDPERAAGDGLSVEPAGRGDAEAAGSIGTFWCRRSATRSTTISPASRQPAIAHLIDKATPAVWPCR